MALIEYASDEATIRVVRLHCTCGAHAIITDVHESGCATFEVMKTLDLALAAERERIAQTSEYACNNPYPNTSGQPARRCQKPPGHSGPHQRNGDTWVHHRPFSDDGVTYCGWHVGGGVVYEGCGEVWPCSTERGES